MKNIAYTAEYQAWRTAWKAVFAPENRKSIENMKIDGCDAGYQAERTYYKTESGGEVLWGAETVINDQSGAEIYRWRTDDDDCDFLVLIRHGNGREYFLFRTGLYGYGVYDVALKREFVYIPDAFESFIWTEAHHNPVNDMLVVRGCYWACPWSVILLDFSNPMAETKWVDVIAALPGDYDKYDNLDFIRWDKDTLILKAGEIIEVDGKTTTKPVELFIPREQYAKWLETGE
ncbi:hypothetical protein FACS1894158_02520 [Betaproteobacteria bacterium]|nr:hypothetical protein FACS1894158_02520 [Betaproteobacteria bacterium]